MVTERAALSQKVVFQQPRLTLNNMYILKVKPTPKQAIENQNKITALELSVINYLYAKTKAKVSCAIAVLCFCNIDTVAK